MTDIKSITDEINSYADNDFAHWSSSLLQINDGGYGENDKLIGVRVPVLRKLAKKYSGLSFDELKQLIKNPIHEIRAFSLMVLVNIFKDNKSHRRTILKLYLDNADYINNWDLVDMSASYIVGRYVYENTNAYDILYKLAKSDNLWKQRISIVSTHYLIKHGLYEHTIKLSEMFLSHEHHLIHKAVGWMLRELGKVDINELYSFLDKYSDIMPRVTLRYAIERLDTIKRSYYMTKH